MNLASFEGDWPESLDTRRRQNAHNISADCRLRSVSPLSILGMIKEVGFMSEKVLIIDDTVETRNRLSALLVEQVAADVVCCPADRSIALHQFAALGPTCVVIDVPVHGPGGFKLVNTLRSLDPKCLLIILSNHATEEFRERANAEGADHFLEKSTQFECVVELVRALEENR